MHEGKLLCVKLKGYQTAINNDYWCLPGGGLDEGEDLIAGLRREMLEETNIEPVVGNLLFINHFSMDDKEHLEFFFYVTNSQDYLNVDLSMASHAEDEIDELDFIDPSSSHILPAFLTTEPLAQHIKDALPVKIFSTLS